MENIISKVDNIEALIDVLDDDYCKLFNEQCKSKFKKIENLLSEVEKVLNEYNFNDDKCSQKIIANKKNKQIMNNLFIFYWYLKNRTNPDSDGGSLEFYSN